MDITAPFAPAKPYLIANGLAFEEILRPDPEARARLGVSGTPTTIVVDPGGRIVKAFTGALIGSTLDSANKYFGASLHADLPPASSVHTFKNGCVQDGLAFSFGSLICWQNHVYDCAPGKGWEQDGSECSEGMYEAKQHPSQ